MRIENHWELIYYMYKDCGLPNHETGILGKVASWKTIDKRIKGRVKWQVQTEKNNWEEKKKKNKKYM